MSTACSRSQLWARLCRPSLWITLLLSAAALVYLGFHVRNGLRSDDVGRLETLLICSVANQLERGPQALYGPYTADNHHVLIHAPLYYRLAAAVAWAVSSLGASPLRAALLAGRMLTALATGLLFFVVMRLASVDRAYRHAGLWAALLVASSPIFGVLAIMVRPDTLAVALQSLGVLLALRTLYQDNAQRGFLCAAYGLFALAVCTKQQSLVGVAITSALLSATALRGRVRFKDVILAHLVFFAAVGVDLAGEDVVTHHRMVRSVFILPGGPFRVLNGAAWSDVRTIGVSVLKSVMAPIALAACAAGLSSRTRTAARLDGIFLVYLVAEAAALVPLCFFNKGAAENYALQPLVYLCILAGRAVERCVAVGPRLQIAILLLCCSMLLARDIRIVTHSLKCEAEDRAAIGELLAHTPYVSRDPRQVYFVGLPQHNRRYGASQLIHDEWLFGSFEAVGDATPRSVWLRSALVAGPVTSVVVPDSSLEIPGLPEPLPALGYRKVRQFGRYRVWERPCTAGAR